MTTAALVFAEGIVGMTAVSTSATGQQGRHHEIAPQVALRLGQQSGSNALVGNGKAVAVRIIGGTCGISGDSCGHSELPGLMPS
jgi:hypothetical protein